MYEFVGKLMGLAIRTKQLLNLNLPSMVWKVGVCVCGVCGGGCWLFVGFGYMFVCNVIV